jgi:hypothetical protein
LIAPEGSKIALAGPRHSCGCNGACKNCRCHCD